MKLLGKILLVVGLIWMTPEVSQGQIKLKNLKDKVNLKKGGKKILRDIIGEDEEENSSGGSTSGNGDRKGKYLSPPSVTDNLANASDAAGADDYSAARDFVRQAMVGVEMEIGKEVLNSFPTSVNGLSYNQDKDQVYSSGWNFVGLGISRVYGTSKKEFSVAVMNNSAILAGYGGLLATGGTYSTNSEETQYKPIRVQGNRGAIQYNEYNDEYEVATSVGQSTVVIFKGRRYSSEEEMMASVNEFDLADIKKRLGEQ